MEEESVRVAAPRARRHEGNAATFQDKEVAHFMLMLQRASSEDGEANQNDPARPCTPKNIPLTRETNSKDNVFCSRKSTMRAQTYTRHFACTNGMCRSLILRSSSTNAAATVSAGNEAVRESARRAVTLCGMKCSC
ncbi:hypothetical protein TRVL_08868 [Trypanosoma vivax]|nr:hypothetical protein TRVL_08868 [Trypanosoma vivax]